MSILVACGDCGKFPITVSASVGYGYCDDCARKNGTYVKKWHEMTLEEKVEDLNRRVGGVEIYTRPIG